MKYVTENGRKYSIRGPYTATQLRASYARFQQEMPTSQLGFMGWLRHNGLIHSEINPRARERRESQARRKGYSQSGEKGE